MKIKRITILPLLLFLILSLPTKSTAFINEALWIADLLISSNSEEKKEFDEKKIIALTQKRLKGGGFKKELKDIRLDGVIACSPKLNVAFLTINDGGCYFLLLEKNISIFWVFQNEKPRPGVKKFYDAFLAEDEKEKRKTLKNVFKKANCELPDEYTPDPVKSSDSNEDEESSAGYSGGYQDKYKTGYKDKYSRD